MSILVRFAPASMTAEQYDEVTREKMEAFGFHLMPILSEAGIDVESTPAEFLEVHNLELGGSV
jgi:hypothetical protein